MKDGDPGITEAAAWKHEHEFVNTTTRWDSYPPQTINGIHDEVKEKRKGVVETTRRDDASRFLYKRHFLVTASICVLGTHAEM